jgi:hypothetical protein
MSNPAQTRAFGRRSTGASPMRPEPAAAPRHAQDARLASFIASEEDALRAKPQHRVVPWSMRAALLAGLAAACLSAGALVAHGSGGAQDPQVASLASAAGVDLSKLGPAILFVTLWRAGRATFWGVLAAHSIAKRLGLSTRFAYAAIGAGAGLTLAVLARVLGFSSGDPLFEATAMTATAAFFYRVFAGTAAPKRAR